MNVILHLTRKDLRRLLIPGAIFLLLLLAKFLLGLQLLDVVDPHQFRTVRDYLNILLIAEFIFAYALVAAVIQEDPLGGSRAFWMTRPISGLRLFAAKLLTLTLVVVLAPTLAALSWWLACGFDAAAIGLAALTTLFVQALIVLVGLPFAALTPTLARYFACTMGALALAVVVKLFLERYGWSSPTLSAGAAATRSALAGVVLCSTVLLLALHQFRTRRTLRSCAIGAGGLSLTVLLGAMWRWDWSSPHTVTGIDPARLQLDIEAAELSTQRQARFNHHITVRGRLSGLPQDCVADRFVGRQTWTWRDGSLTHLPIDKPAFSGAFESVVRKSLGLPVVTTPLSALRNFEEIDSDGTRLVAFSAGWPAAAVQKIQDQPVSLSLDVRAQLLRPVLVGEMVPEVGGSLPSASGAARVLQITSTAQQRADIFLLEIVPAARRGKASLRQIFLVDRPAGFLTKLSEDRSEQITAAGVSLSIRTLSVHPAQLPGSEKLSVNDLGRFRLAAIDYQSLGSIQLSAHAPNIEVKVD